MRIPGGVFLPAAALLLAACAPDEEVAAARAAREYCRALAMQRYDVAWGMLTEEGRNRYREVADAIRDPERYEASEVKWTLWVPSDPGRGPISAEAIHARDCAASVREILWHAWLETPRVQDLYPEGKGVYWPQVDLSLHLVRQDGAWRVDLTGDRRSLSGCRDTLAGPFGRQMSGWTWLEVKPEPMKVRLPLLPGTEASESAPYTLPIWVDATGVIQTRTRRLSDKKDLDSVLFDRAEFARDESSPARESLVLALVHADRALTWARVWDLLLALTDPAIRYRDCWFRTGIDLFPGPWGDPSPWIVRGIPLVFTTMYLHLKIKLLDARVEIAVGPEDVRAGRLARLPEVWAAVPEERKVEGLRLILDGDLTLEDALRTILAAAALNPARIVLGARAEIDPEVEPVTLDLATAPTADPPPPAPLPWPIPLTIHHGERPAK